MRNVGERRTYITARLSILAAVVLYGAPLSARVPDFTFIQATDVHTPMAQSKQVLGAAKDQGEIDLTAYGIKAPAPSFAIATGDLTEFGGGSGWWPQYLSYYDGWKIPVYHSLGNHDNTWHSEMRDMRKAGQKPYYSFDSHDCHFICLMSATPQDPRPSFGEEQIVWLRDDLKKVSKQTPIFAFFHHPLGCTEYASPYDWYRLLDELRPYNLAAIFAGHYHSIRYVPVAGIDQIVGGTTFGENAGLTFISVKDEILRVAYQREGKTSPDEKMLEKSIAPKPDYPRIRLTVSRSKAGKSGYAINAEISTDRTIDSAAYTVDDEWTADLKPDEDRKRWTASQPVDKLLNGQHFVRVTFKSGQDEFTKSQTFEARDYVGSTTASSWRVYLSAASKATATIYDGVVFV
ncbi:MAG: metallophosphoesterase, partial [Armatimonadota bacterium]